MQVNYLCQNIDVFIVSCSFDLEIWFFLCTGVNMVKSKGRLRHIFLDMGIDNLTNPLIGIVSILIFMFKG